MKELIVLLTFLVLLFVFYWLVITSDLPDWLKFILLK